LLGTIATIALGCIGTIGLCGTIARKVAWQLTKIVSSSMVKPWGKGLVPKGTFFLLLDFSV